MPTPNDAALIRQLAQRALELKRITDIRNATAASAQVIEAAYTAEVAAQAELAATATRLGVPLAEATTSYGSAAASGAATTLGWPAILAGIAIFGAVAGSTYLYRNWGKPDVDPVKAGPAMLASRPQPSRPQPTRSQPTGPQAPVLGTTTQPNTRGEYYLYAVNTSGWSFYIGRPAEVEGRAARSFTDGGTGSQPIEYRKLTEKKFASVSEANEYLKARVTPGKHSVWTGRWMKFEGGEEYRTLHVGW